MAGGQQPPLDEIQWNAPSLAQSMNGIHTNTVLPYFAASPFFDAMSNNATLTTQALNNANMFYIIQTRADFEARLKTMQGLEFMVTHDPSENDTKIPNSGVWVIRKQIRRKRQGMPDDITPISSYYVVNENVYMAPSVVNIIGSRMLSAVTSLTKLIAEASSLPTFTPATGHTYLPPVSKNPTGGANLQATRMSRATSPLPGGNTPMPATQDTVGTAKGMPKPSSDIDYRGLQMLAGSYDLLLRYGNEYMDENPVVGEPGAFKLAKAHNPALASFTSTTKSSFESSQAATPGRGTLTPQPPPIKTEDLPAPVKKFTKGGEKSPTTPGGSKEKRMRRKSKAAGAGDSAMPKITTPKPTTPK